MLATHERFARIRWIALCGALLGLAFAAPAFAGGTTLGPHDGTNQCNNGSDDDGDALVDEADPGCRNRDSDDESPQCDDGVDNENGGAGDGLVDFGEDPECESGWWDDESVARSSKGVPGDGNGGVVCGDGTELAFFALPVWWLWRRRPRA
jgi:hypothetical protein